MPFVHIKLALLLTMGLCGCTVGPKYHPPTAPVPAAPNYKGVTANFKDTQGWKVASPQDEMLHGKWWEIFHEPELNALEEQLNIDNQNIKFFFENYLAARAIIRETRAQYYPTVTVGAGWTRSRSSANATPSNSTSGASNGGSRGTQISEFTTPLDISWAPDLFGRIRNTVRSNQTAAQVSAADLENERLLEQATLAETYFQIRGQDLLQQILNDTVKADQGILELAQARYDTGTDSQVPVEEAQQALEAAQAAAIGVTLAREQFEHAIGTLLGKSATEFSLPVRAFTSKAPPIPTGTPSQLLERRPDISAAERLMAEANATIGIGYAAYYPTVTLSAGGGFTSSTFSKLFSAPSRFWSIGPSISETVFDGGLRRATIDQFVATYNADVANYRQIVLTAFQQVEDALSQTRLLSQQIERQQASTESATRAYELEKARYETGLDPYLNLLTTQTTLLQSQESLLGLRVQEMTSAVSLVEALGGAWDASQLPTAHQVTEKAPRDQRMIQQ
ncbi:MAG TPA: efflux transporter outer membrane subunit [Candidatus Angelobacter sp.]|nr:efflux transporter outer membrane subunit [Candidatus Angelobacter sp.]